MGAFRSNQGFWRERKRGVGDSIGSLTIGVSLVVDKMRSWHLGEVVSLFLGEKGFDDVFLMVAHNMKS